MEEEREKKKKKWPVNINGIKSYVYMVDKSMHVECVKGNYLSYQMLLSELCIHIRKGIMTNSKSHIEREKQKRVYFVVNLQLMPAFDVMHACTFLPCKPLKPRTILTGSK